MDMNIDQSQHSIYSVLPRMVAVKKEREHRKARNRPLLKLLSMHMGHYQVGLKDKLHFNKLAKLQ
jgi:hypothetical protein